MDDLHDKETFSILDQDVIVGNVIDYNHPIEHFVVWNKTFEDEMLLSVAALLRGKFACVRCPSPGSPGNDQSKDNKKYKV